MYVITSKQDNVVAFISETLDHNEAGQPLITVNGSPIVVGFPCNEFSNVTIPDGIEPQKYCFDGTTFTENADYTEPPKTTEQQIAELNATIDDLTVAILEG